MTAGIFSVLDLWKTGLMHEWTQNLGRNIYACEGTMWSSYSLQSQRAEIENVNNKKKQNSAPGRTIRSLALLLPLFFFPSSAQLYYCLGKEFLWTRSYSANDNGRKADPSFASAIIVIKEKGKDWVKDLPCIPRNEKNDSPSRRNLRESLLFVSSFLPLSSIFICSSRRTRSCELKRLTRDLYIFLLSYR